MYKAYYQSPIGLLEIKATKKGITVVGFVESKSPTDENEISFEFSDINDAEKMLENPMPVYLKNCLMQLKAYFEGNRKTFDFALAPEGTAFQTKVWAALLDVPFGKTASYKDIAKSLGDLKAVRAVGFANGKNPIAIVIPCHRIIGSNGTLTGYAGGLWRKKWLLQHEEKYAGFDKQLRLF